MPDMGFCAPEAEMPCANNSYEAILDALYKNTSAASLVEECQRILQNPVQLINVSFEIVCASTAYSVKVPDEKWLKNEELGSLQQECIENLRASKNLYKANKVDVPVHVANKSLSDKKSDTWICRVMRNGKIFGYLVVLECNRAIGRQEEQIIAAFAKAISIAVRVEQGESNLLGARIEKMVEKLLNTPEVGQTSGELAASLCTLGRLPHKNIVVITVRITRDATEGISLKYYEKILAPYMKKAESFLHGDDVVFIVSSKTQRGLDFFTGEELDSLEEILKTMGLYAAVSKVCKDLSFLGKAYRETCDTLTLAERLNLKKGVHVYESNAAFYPLLSYESHGDILDLCHPGILSLYEKDRQKGTELVHTLDVYLENNLNINLTAKAMSLHRNSLYYRIKKIETMLNCVLGEDSKRDFNFRYSILILKFLGHIPTDKMNKGD